MKVLKSTIPYIQRPNRPLHVYAIFYLLLLYLPVTVLPIFSFVDSYYFSFPIPGWTFKWYETMFNNEPMHASLINSINVGLAVSVFATILGILGAKAVTRYQFPGKKPIVFVIMLPLVIPVIVVAVALLVMLSRMGVKLSLYSVTFGHALFCVPFSMAALIPRFHGSNKSMEEASMDLGENAWMTFWRVTFPMILPGVLASVLLCFTISFDEFMLSFFLGGTDPTFPVYVYSQVRFPQRLPNVLAMSSTILVSSIILVYIAMMLRKPKSKLE
jgi:spermidine/putrescine transport system permease protein